MKFSEKLQKLRKENKMSQEQLADMLDVSRQSVSKWESGQTYPEMDKLISMCKIFKCSLDELTNDEIKEVNSSSKNKNNFSNLIDELLELINRSFSIFKNMEKKDIVNIAIEMGVLLILLAVMKHPFNYIDNLGYNIFVNFGNTIGDVLTSIFHFVVMACYIILSFIIFVYIYKIRVLDRYENIKSNDQEEVKEENTDSKIKEERVEEKIVKKESKKHTYHVFDLLNSLVMIFIKFIAFWISIPFIGALLFLSMLFIIMIILLFMGVYYFGILLVVLFSIGLSIVFIELIFDFLFNKKIEVKRIFLTFIISIVGLGMAFGLSAIEISNTTYENSIPKVTTESITKEYNMTSDMIILGNDTIEYVVDNNINNVKIVATYSDKYAKPLISVEGNSIHLSDGYLDTIAFKNLFNLIIDDLKIKNLHNYEKLYDINYKIYASQANINILKNNVDSYYNNEEDSFYENEINEYQNTVNEYEEEINNLTNRNVELQSELDEYKTKLNDYKDRIQSLLEE